KVNVRRDASRNPLFDVMFIMQNMEMNSLELEGLRIKNYNFKNNIAKFDITMTAIEGKDDIYLNLGYSKKLYREETIERMKNHFLNLVNKIIINKNIKIKNIEISNEEEKELILNKFNNTTVNYQSDKTIQQLFEKQVKKTPDNIAIVCGDKKVTYRELNERANSIARTLRKKGVIPNSIVAIMLERSIDMMVGLFAILKSGASYLPIDPSHPEDRIKYMIEDSKTNVLLTEGKFSEKIKFNGEEVYLDNKESYSNDLRNLKNVNESSDLAYVIYTSGSTGKPKGVMVEHKQVNNFIHGIEKEINIKSYKNMLCVTTVSFDIFVLESIVPLSYGLTITIAKENEQVDAILLNQIIIKNNIDILQATPSRMQLLIEENSFKESSKVINSVLVGGEAVPLSLLKELQKYSNLKIFNMYGPTETTIWSAVKEISEDKQITIGKPIANTKIYIVDKNNNVQPIGVAGELCISGDGVVRGYLNNEKLTAEKFIENPYKPGERMYKTGDLARWLSNGSIEFLGRIDHQVKIRGFRIELGEIESKLLEIEAIKEVIVVDKEKNDNKYLCAYYVGDKNYTVNELRTVLEKNLPEYMIPSYFMKLENMPLNTNGKISRNELPNPDIDIVTGAVYEAPRNETEEALVKIWEEVLGVNNIGINDNFKKIFLSI
ncbi:amino acid adenylation domain-containing protein, partial [Clostridium cavendishii DSM 21758]